MVEIELPWPPSVNHYWRHTEKGHYISTEGKKYRHLVCLYCLNKRNKFGKNDRLSVSISAYPPDKRKRDLDNLFKSLLDSLQYAQVYHDDNQIDQLMIQRHPFLFSKVLVMVDNL